MPPCYKHAAPPGLKTCVFLSRKRVGGPNPYEFNFPFSRLLSVLCISAMFFYVLRITYYSSCFISLETVVSVFP